MKLKKSTWLPIVLLLYLAVMSWYGYAQYKAGEISALYFFGVIGVTLIIIFLVHVTTKRRERLRKERQDDIK